LSEQPADIEYMLNIFRAQCKEVYSEVFFVIDAVDECEKHQRNDVVSLISSFQSASIKLLLTFRPPLRSELAESFKTLRVFQLRIFAEKADIENFLRRKTANENPQLQDEIMKHLPKSAEGGYVSL
jgi:hypothetical protein